LGEDWKDGLDPWQVQLAESLDQMVEDMGRVPTTDASYVDASPYAGQNCGTCIASGETGCDWVAISCTPEGWCKFNVTPVLIRASGENAQYYKARKAVDLSPQPAAPMVAPEQDDSSEDTSDESTSSGGQDLASGKIKKEGEAAAPAPVNSGPTVEGVHVDSIIGSVGVLPKFVPVDLDIIDEEEPEVLVAAKSAEIPGTIQKNAEQRYTLGPWYVPNQKDAHGEWTDPEELQKALWGYVENGDRDIRLQHNVNIVAGKWVEAMMWPHAVEVPMLKADTNEIVKTTFPAGTAFLGVQWEPWAWELVKKGEIRGFSIGGTGSPIEVDLPTEFDDPDHFSAFGK
jgi:hypothetical protein